MAQQRTPFCHTWWGIALQIVQTALILWLSFLIWTGRLHG